MLWDGEFPLLELHLDRLTDSANYFDFSCDRDAIRTILLTAASRFRDDLPRKVRMLLQPNGETSLEAGVLPNASNRSDPARVCIAIHRTDPADRFLFHKTTRREFYNRANTAAHSCGFDEVLFLNTRGEITEGAVNNVFIESSGRCYTPPLDCGVLPGVYRRHLLSTRTGIEERVLTLNDLKSADSVYICNAVRGLRRVTVEFESSISF